MPSQAATSVSSSATSNPTSTPGTAQPVPTNSAVVPPVAKPASLSRWLPWSRERDERNQLEKDGSQNHNIRRIAAYGALVLATILYGAGLVAIATVLGLWPGHGRFAQDMWHIAVAILAALFTVPTVLVLAVLKATTTKPKDEALPSSVHETLGQMLTKIFDKLVDIAK